MNPDRAATPSPSSQAEESPIILNVNDDDANRYAVSRMLAREGFRVEEASDGTTALLMVMQGRHDLVVLDVDLPDVNGFEVCRRIKANPTTAAIPVLHISARYVRDADRSLGLISGADGYLIQPVEPLVLVASVRGLLRMRRAEDAARAGAERIEQLERELQELGRRMSAAPTSGDPEARSRSLRDNHPEEFASLAARCERLLDLAIQQQKYRVENDISTELRKIGDRLGSLGAGPRDVVELYGDVLKARSAGVVAALARAYLDEGRLLVLEMMGHLVSYYRDHPTGSLHRR